VPAGGRATAHRGAASSVDQPSGLAFHHMKSAIEIANSAGFILPVRGLVTSAGFVVALRVDMQRMPGLGTTPALMNIGVDDDGRTVGLF
jgi:formyltetrahydrofolate synthetase